MATYRVLSEALESDSDGATTDNRTVEAESKGAAIDAVRRQLGARARRARHRAVLMP